MSVVMGSRRCSPAGMLLETMRIAASFSGPWDELAS